MLETKQMEQACKELDEVKAEMEKLKVEFKNKSEMHERAKRAHSELLVKFEEAKFQIERQDKELNSKSIEISETGQICKDLKSRMQEKEMVVRQLSLTNEKQRKNLYEKITQMEGKNKELQLALDEATTKNVDFERKISACTEEVKGLRKLLLVAEKKCYEAEQNSQLAKELRLRDETIEILEEENRNVQGQLKWKKEQFKHLEEAHKKLQDQFLSNKNEWKKEKNSLTEENSLLQKNLDSQTRISENLQTRFTMCNQALAHEESKRKVLEIQVSESQSLFQDVHARCQEAQSKIESLSIQRDEDIAKLRNLLGTKDVLFKEMEFKITYLEQDNQEMLGSIKEFQEAQIKDGGSVASVEKLRNKLRSVEHAHSECAKKLKEREINWNSRLEKIDKRMKDSLAQLKVKDSYILELQENFKSCQFSLELLNEEMDVVLIVVKSEYSEIYSKLVVDVEQKEEQLASLVKKIEFGNSNMEKELNIHKMLLEESSKNQHLLEEEILQMGKSLKNVLNDLEKANSELDKNVREKNLIEMEFQKWKSIAESLKVSLEENQTQLATSLFAHEKTVEHENESLLSIVKEQEITIANLQNLLASQETASAAKSEEIMFFKKEKETYVQIVEERECSIEKLQKEFDRLEIESITRELDGCIRERIGAEKAFEHENEKVVELIEEKDCIIENLQKEFDRLEIESITRELEGCIRERIATEKTFEHENEKVLELIEDKNRIIEDLLLNEGLLDKKLINLVQSSFSEIIEKLILVDMLREAVDEANDNTNVHILEKEGILSSMEKDDKLILQICHEDNKIMGMLKNILDVNLIDNELENFTETKMTKKDEVGSDERSPLKEIINYQQLDSGEE